MESQAELEKILRSLLISSPTVTKANRLLTDFVASEGKNFPYRELGFSSFIGYLRSIPTVVKLVPYNSENPDVLPILTKESSHIDKLVSKQKLTAPKKNVKHGGFRAWFSNLHKPPPIRRRPPSRICPPLSQPLPNKGVYVSEIENQVKQRFRGEYITEDEVQSGNNVLSHTKNTMRVVNKEVFPRMFYPSGPIDSNHYRDMNMKDDNTTVNENNFGNIESLPEEKVHNYTIKHCTLPSLELQRNARVEDEMEDSYDPENECNISKGMIKNFRLILEKNPQGIWTTELPQLYKEEFGVTLDLLELGYSSAIIMASYLPHVFTYKRSGPHDWKLYDARSVKQETTLLTDDMSGYREPTDYIPQSILHNITRLVEEIPDGIRSTLLLSLYEDRFKKKLDLDTLGYSQFDDFLEVLKKVITVRKVTNYFFLLPKHTTLPLENTATTEDILQIPDGSFQFFGLDNVLKPDETIPEQELPPIQTNPEPDSPLIQMDVRVAEVISPGLFYIILDSKYNELQNMMDDLDKFYKQEQQQYQIPLPLLTLNLICACEYEGNWHRVKVTGFRKNDYIEIEYIDYGTPGRVKASELRFLQSDFAKLPAQAICAKLLGIQPSNGAKKWPQDVCVEFLNLVTEQRLIAYVFKIEDLHKKDRVKIEIILFNTNDEEDIIINEYFVNKGVAEYSNEEINNSEENQQSGKQKHSSATLQSSTQPHIPTEASIELVNKSFEEFDISEYFPRAEGSPKNGQALTDQTKRVTRPPPGFESSLVDSSELSSQQPYFSNQANSACYLPGYQAQPQPVQINNYNVPLLLSHSFPNNYRQIQPNILQRPSFSSTSQTPNYLYNCWSSDVLINPLPPPVTQIHPLNPPTPFHFQIFNNSPQNTTFFPKETYCNTQSNYNHISNPQRVQYYSGSSPGWNNKSWPQSNTQQITSNQLSTSRQHGLLPEQSSITKVTEEVVFTHHRSSPIVEAPSSVASNEVRPTEDKEEHVNRSNTSLATSTIEISNICNCGNSTFRCSIHELREKKLNSPLKPSVISISNNYIRNEHDDDENGSISKCRRYANDELQKEIVVEPQKNETLFKSSSTTAVKFQNSNSLAINKISNTSECTIATKFDDHQFNTLTDLKTKLNDKLPDSWEDIEPDDIPAKAQNFSIDFKNPLDIQINDEFKEDLKCNKLYSMVTEKPMSPIEIIKTPVNWKEIFNPDSTNELKSYNKSIQHVISAKFDKDNMKKIQIQKLEIDHKFFHLICINNKLAVLSQEFYCQFTSLNFHVICKIIEVKYKPFTVIRKSDEPVLFSKLDKADFCGGASKGVILKFNKFSISYLPQVPEVFAVLNLQNNLLLSELKKISDEFDSC